MAQNNAAKNDDRNNASGIRNVRQVIEDNDNYEYPTRNENQWYGRRADNDNNEQGNRQQQITNVRQVTGTTNNATGRTSIRPNKIVANQNVPQTADNWSLFRTVMVATTKIYVVQICFGIIALVGFGLAAGVDAAGIIDTTTFGAAGAFSAGLFLLGAAVAALCGFFTYLGASGLFQMNNRDPLSGLSIFIAAVCIVALLCPIVSLFPVMWLWCLYVAFWGGRT